MPKGKRGLKKRIKTSMLAAGATKKQARKGSRTKAKAIKKLDKKFKKY